MKYYEEYIINNYKSNDKYKVIVINYSKNHIYVENIDTKVIYKILNKFYLNRCFDLDIVEISDIENNIVENDNENDDEIYSEYSSNDELEDKQPIKHCKNKRIIKKIEENNKIYNTPIGGILEINTLKKYGVNKRNIQYFKFKPLDKSYPNFLVASSCKKKYKKNIYCTINFKEWKTTQLYPYGMIHEIYGEIDNKEALENILINKYNLENKYKLNIQDEDNIYEYDMILKYKSINNMLLYKRKKYFVQDIISIDPEGCKDIDDAFHCEETDDNYLIYIHISDVSEYIKPDSKFDNIAKKNYNTIYNNNSNNNIEMLPKFLSNKLCSLSINNDYNLVVTIKYIYDKNTCELLDIIVYDSIIKMKYNLSYEEAQNILENDNAYNAIKNSIQILSKLSNEKDTHKIIEYFMVLTNSKVCELIYNECNFSIIRKYKQNKQNIVNDDLELNKFLCYYNNESAKYEVINNYDNNNNLEKINHDLLNLKYYTHFTSPIRRYMDIELHRLYKYIKYSSLKSHNNNYINNLNQLCININKKEKEIKKYYRELNKLDFIFNNLKNINTDNNNNIYEGYIINLVHNIDLYNFHINIYIPSLKMIYNYNLLGNNRYIILDILKLQNNIYEITNKVNNNKYIIRNYQKICVKLFINLLKNDINKIELNIIEPLVSY